MNEKHIEIFIESLRTNNNSDLIDTILEGFYVSHQSQLEGIGDTLRNAKNRVKTIAATGKEALFGASEEQSFKNTISRTILNKKLYDSNSRRGQDAIKKIVNLIIHGTQNPSLPRKIAKLADNVLVDCIEAAIANNPSVNVKIVKPSALRSEMDVVFDEIAQSVIKPLEKLGKIKLNDDRLAYVTEWWDKNVVSKMGKYFDALNSAQLKIEQKNQTAPKQTVRKPVNKPVNNKQPINKQTVRKPVNNKQPTHKPTNKNIVNSTGKAPSNTNRNKRNKSDIPLPPPPEE